MSSKRKTYRKMYRLGAIHGVQNALEYVQQLPDRESVLAALEAFKDVLVETEAAEPDSRPGLWDGVKREVTKRGRKGR